MPERKRVNQLIEEVQTNLGKSAPPLAKPPTVSPKWENITIRTNLPKLAKADEGFVEMSKADVDKKLTKQEEWEIISANVVGTFIP